MPQVNVDQSVGAFRNTDRVDYSSKIGSEFSGLQLSSLGDSEIEAVKRLLAERGVLVFRDQRMSREEHIELGRRFGQLHRHPSYDPIVDTDAIPVRADANSTRVPGGEGWHADVTCDMLPPAISMLKIDVTPSRGGDTGFSSMYEAFDCLSEPIKRMLLGLTARHSGEVPYTRIGRRTTAATYPVSHHPVVCTHQITGRNALYVNSVFTDRIDGMSELESDSLLKLLFDHIAYGIEFQCRVRWEPNTLAMWDNRCAQHFASWDYFPEPRSGWRVTTRGDQPYLAK